MFAGDGAAADYSLQLGLAGGGAIIVPGVGGSLQFSGVVNIPDVQRAGNFGLVFSGQGAGGFGGGAYGGVGGGVQANYASSVPQTLFAVSDSNYAEVDVGAAAVNGSASVNLDDKGNIASSSVTKTFGSVKLGPGGGLGAFFGMQGQVNIVITPNSLLNLAKGNWVTLPSGKVL